MGGASAAVYGFIMLIGLIGLLPPPVRAVGIDDLEQKAPPEYLDSSRRIFESERDLIGLYQQKQHARSYNLLRSGDFRVLNIPSDERFAAVWKPEGYASNRILVLLHGTAGAAYDGMKDEMAMAKAYDVMLVGIQWHDPRSNTYDKPKAVYRRIGEVLRYLNETDGVPLTAVALSGFSRGGAISYEVAWRDLQTNKFFKLVIAHSGGIPLDGVTAPGESSAPGVFYTNLTGKKLGENPLAGAHFFLYAGQKDEQWGTTMADDILNAKALITQNGGVVEECIIDPDGTHMGYLKTPEYHERSMKTFARLLEESTDPIRPLEIQPEGSSER